jgi:hypothetical protein
MESSWTSERSVSPHGKRLVDIGKLRASCLGLGLDESARPELVRVWVVRLVVHQVVGRDAHSRPRWAEGYSPVKCVVSHSLSTYRHSSGIRSYPALCTRELTSIKWMQANNLLDEAIQEREILKPVVGQRIKVAEFRPQRILDVSMEAKLEHDEVQVHPRLMRSSEPHAEKVLRNLRRPTPVLIAFGQLDRVPEKGQLLQVLTLGCHI